MNLQQGLCKPEQGGQPQDVMAPNIGSQAVRFHTLRPVLYPKTLNLSFHDTGSTTQPQVPQANISSSRVCPKNLKIGLRLAGNEGMEKNMETAITGLRLRNAGTEKNMKTTIMGYIGTIRIHSFIPSLPKARKLKTPTSEPI